MEGCRGDLLEPEPWFRLRERECVHEKYLLAGWSIGMGGSRKRDKLSIVTIENNANNIDTTNFLVGPGYFRFCTVGR